MSEPSKFRVYRSNVNLPRMPNGSLHEIDDTDGRWADYIAAGWITPVGPPSDYQAPTSEKTGFAPSIEVEKSAFRQVAEINPGIHAARFYPLDENGVPASEPSMDLVRDPETGLLIDRAVDLDLPGSSPIPGVSLDLPGSSPIEGADLARADRLLSIEPDPA